MIFLILYADDILLIGNDVGALFAIKIWLSNHFDMNDLGKTNSILRFKFLWDRMNKILSLSQTTYITKILVKFLVHNSKKGLLPFKHGVPISKDQCPKTLEEKQSI